MDNSQQLPVNRKKLFAEINNLSSLEESLQNNSLLETLQKIAYVCTESAKHIQEQGEDFAEKNMLKRNTKYLNELGKRAQQIAEQYDNIVKESKILYEEMMPFINRFYDNSQKQVQNQNMVNPGLKQESLGDDEEPENKRYSRLWMDFDKDPGQEGLNEIINFYAQYKYPIKLKVEKYDQNDKRVFFTIEDYKYNDDLEVTCSDLYERDENIQDMGLKV